MPIDDAAYRGEADAGSLVLSLAVQTLKGIEQASGMAHVEAAAVVADPVSDAIAAQRGRAEDSMRGAAACRLNFIALPTRFCSTCCSNRASPRQR